MFPREQCVRKGRKSMHREWGDRETVKPQMMLASTRKVAVRKAMGMEKT